jgi:hypothetical protein
MTSSVEDRGVDAAMRLFHQSGPEPDSAGLAGIRRQVLTRTAAVDAGRMPVRRLSLRVAMGAAGVVVVAGVATTAVSVWSGGPSGPSGVVAESAPATSARDLAAAAAIVSADSVAATMDLLLDRVTNAQALNVGQGGYVYTSQRDVSVQAAEGAEGPAYYVTEELTERWSAVNEGTLPQLVRSTRGLNAHPLTAADGARLVRYGTDYTKVTTSTYDPSTDPKRGTGAATPPSLTNPTPAYLASLPTDRAGLLAVLRTEAAKDGPAAESDHLIFKRVSALATAADALLSPRLRVALYQVLATLPGVDRVPGQVDLAGRAGVAIAETDHNGRRTEIIIDPVSSRMIGSRMVAVTAVRGIPAGTVIWSATSTQTIVHELGAKS